MANELQLAAGLKLTNPAPADAYYCKPQVGQAPAQPYATVAEACSFVPQSLRYQGMTVNVAGIGEMSWLTDDLSNNGLVLKVVPGDGTGGGGSPAIYADFIFTAETDGAQSFPMPAGTLGIDGQPAWYQTDTGLVDTLGNWDFTGGNLVTYAATDIKAGDKVFGRRYYGGTGGVGGDPGTGGDYTDADAVAANQQAVADAKKRENHTGTQDISTVTGTLPIEQSAPLEEVDLAKLADILQPYLDLYYVRR